MGWYKPCGHFTPVPHRLLTSIYKNDLWRTGTVPLLAVSQLLISLQRLRGYIPFAIAFGV